MSANTLDDCEVCCQKEYAISHMSNNSDVHQTCPRCGDFKLSVSVSHRLRSNTPGQQKRAIISSWIRQQNRNRRVPTIQDKLLTHLLNCSKLSIDERALALLQEAKHSLLNQSGGTFNLDDPRFIGATSSATPNDILDLANLLKEDGLIDFCNSGNRCRILLKGYNKLNEGESDR